MKILTKENRVGAKSAPTAISRTFTPLERRVRFLVATFLSDPVPENNIG